MFRLAWSILLGTSLILSSCGSAPVATSPEPVTTEDDNPEETVDQGTDTSIQETAPEDSTDPEATPEPEETHEPEVTPEPEWYYAQAVESYEAGPEAGFGQDRFPGIVLGPPSGPQEDCKSGRHTGPRPVTCGTAPRTHSPVVIHLKFVEVIHIPD